MADLRTDYKDDVLDTSKNEKRKYNLISNADGTVSLEDVTAYTQVGDSFGAADINATNKKVNEIDSSLTNESQETFNFGVKDGVRGFYTNPSRADDCFIPFSSVKVIGFSMDATPSGTRRAWITFDVSKAKSMRWEGVTPTMFFYQLTSTSDNVSITPPSAGTVVDVSQWYAITIMIGNPGMVINNFSFT